MTALFRWAVFLALVLGVGAWVLTAPTQIEAEDLAGVEADPDKGEQIFLAAGCASCHAAPKAEGDAALVLSGGQRFASPFGTFLAPNISPDPEHGIGDWTDAQIVTAVMEGVSPQGAHYYPVFPYAAYSKARTEDILSLIDYLRTLPPSSTPSQSHEVRFPFNIRRSLGLWKQLFIGDDWVLEADLTEEETRGRYLVEALAHCGECHTERNALGGLDTNRWLGGAPNPVGEGRIPAIDPGALKWSETDIAYYLETGFTPEFDSAGGHMTAVIDKISKLPDTDRAAIAAYIKAVPPLEAPAEAG